MIITIQDVRRYMCVDGITLFFDRHPELDRKDALENGLDSEILLSLNDAMVTEIVNRAIARQEKKNAKGRHGQ